MKNFLSRSLRWFLFFLLAAVCVCATPLILPSQRALASDTTVDVWLTTSDLSQALTQQSPLSFAPDGSTGLIAVDENQVYQPIDGGFGAALTDSAAALISSSSQKDAIMGQLFDWQNGGIGLNFLRVPLGASDFIAAPSPTPAWYTYDDVAPGQTDPSLAQFSLAHDQSYILPLLQQAIGFNSGIELVATPWSPPAWMRTGDSLLGTTGGTLNTDDYATYAQYFVQYIQAYANAGVPIFAVTPQNEPTVNQSYPSMGFSADEETNFIKNDLGPAFASANLSTKILAWDDNWNSDDSYANAVLSDPTAAQYVAGSAWHCYGGDPSIMSAEHNDHPDKAIYETECSPGCGGIAAAPLTISSMQNWAQGVMMWNMALRPDGGPDGPDGAGTPCTPLVTIDGNGNPTYTRDFYQLGHFSKFLGSGGSTYRIAGSATGDIQAVSFKNQDGTKVVVAYNSSSSSQTFNVSWNNQSFSYTLPAGATVTFKWSGTTANALSHSGWAAAIPSSNVREDPSRPLIAIFPHVGLLDSRKAMAD